MTTPRAQLDTSTLRDSYMRILATLICILFLAVAASAKTITVTGTGDTIAVDGLVTLREAITAANTNAPSGDAPAGDPGLDTIAFNIPGGGVRTINLALELPAISEPITIDGYTQPGSSANTMAVGSDAVLLIELNGTNAGAFASGLAISGGGSTIKGLVINRFGGFGIYLLTNGINIIAGNFIGTNAQGTAAAALFPVPNNNVGVLVRSANNTIGGLAPADRNVVSGSSSASGGSGVWLDTVNAAGNKVLNNYIGTSASGDTRVPNLNTGFIVNYAVSNIIGGTTTAERNVISGNNSNGISMGGDAANNQVLGNFIGTKADGLSPLKNGQAGIDIENSPTNNTIGGSAAGAGNVIAFNGVGINLFGPQTINNAILGNSIHSNTGIGIELFSGTDGVTSNDDNTGDADTGPNKLQNFPVITSAVANGGTTTIQGTLDSAFSTTFRVEFFSNNACDSSGFGEGQKYLGFTNVMTDATGKANLTFNVPTASVVGTFFTATATDPNGNTSEFSACTSGVVLSPGTLQFGTAAYGVSENGGLATITVTRTGGSTGAISVSYAAGNGTATAGQDYSATSGTLNWADGDASSKTFNVPLINDSLDEPDETVNLTLSNPGGGATLGNQSTATLTIVDDDVAPSISINDLSQAEGNSGTTNFTFTVTLDAASGQTVLVNYATADGAATAGSDYQPMSGTLTFAPGETSKPVTVLVNGDTQVEPDESFFVNLSSPVNATIAKAQGTGTIVNDDSVTPMTVQFSQGNFSVNEDQGSVTITVSRTGDSSGVASVDYKTTDTDTFTVGCAAKQGQAFGRCDFATTVGTLSFAAGETSKSFVVPIINDSYAEGIESFGLLLSNPSGAILGAAPTATVTINDNEASDGPNPLPNTSFFVRQHYLDFLSREPEANEPWSGVLNGCSDQFNTDPNNPAAGCDRLVVSGSFFGSPEFRDKGLYIIDFYRVAFNRLPTYVEFSTDLASISGTTAAEANAKRAAFANSFVQRPEFTSIYGGMSNAGSVNALMNGNQGQAYNLSSITTYDPMNPNGPTKVTLSNTDLVTALNSSTLTRAQVLRAIVQSDQISLNLEAVRAFVASQYYGYLRRAPDAAGFNAWVNYLQNNPADFRTMVNGFLYSAEYKLRFGP